MGQEAERINAKDRVVPRHVPKKEEERRNQRTTIRKHRPRRPSRRPRQERQPNPCLRDRLERLE